MILERMLTGCSWDFMGIHCLDSAMTEAIYWFLREAILDRHIYLNKVIGFNVDSMYESNPHVGKVICRHPDAGESYVELVNNMLDKIFIEPFETNELKMYCHPGLNTCEDNAFQVQISQPTPCLYTNPNVITALQDTVSINVKLLYDCGYRSVDQNSKALKDPSYFPCYTDYSLNGYVRILPQRSNNTVQLRFYNGMTVDIFKSIMERYNSILHTRFARKEELQWVSNFGL